MKDNLTLLNEARNEVGVSTTKDSLNFYSYFVGALQSHVPTEEWANAVATAKDIFRGTRALSSV